MTGELASKWAARFGLATAPLFADSEIERPADHHVLLDGGYGSFALSVTEEARLDHSDATSWAWSSNLAHHVTISKNDVSVARWDRPEPEVLTLVSVEKRLDAFYEYLIADRVRSNKKVVDHLVGLFRRVRSLVAEVRIPDDRSTEAYLAFLDIIAARRAGHGAMDGGPAFTTEGEELVRKLSPTSVESLIEHTLTAEATASSMRLYPGLAVRHAGSEIFQEAHFELVRSPVPDLFGYVGPAETKIPSRGGAHFTPPALARSLCEKTLGRIPDIHARREITIMDPACGSGAFLHEAARSLQRMGFNGKLRLIGRDISGSAATMADYVLKHAQRDWQPAGGIEIDIKTGDSLATALPKADVVLMNPPFVSWAALSAVHREQMRTVLGTTLSGRGDLSMAFVTHAMRALPPGGVLGALLPSSLLNLQAAEEWRASLVAGASLRFVASLGDHGLFAHALVSIAALVVQIHDGAASQEPLTALVTANNAESTGEALRALRRNDPGVSGSVRTARWRLFNIAEETFTKRPTWRLTSPEVEAVMARVLDAGARRIDELFDVRQGVRTGNNKVFVISENDLHRLPKREYKYFLPAIINDSIYSGQLKSSHYVFYPHSALGEMFDSEESVKEAVPTYYNLYLLPNKDKLRERSSIVRSGRSDWWGLSEKRSWALNREPRIVSKYFGGPGGFATDMDAKHIVVQGHAWLPKWNIGEQLDDDGSEEISSAANETLLYAYTALMNSRGFGSVIEVFSPHVAGGQFDLSPRYVNAIPIPDLSALASDERGGSMILRLAELAKAPEQQEGLWRATLENIVSDLYGGPLTAMD